VPAPVLLDEIVGTIVGEPEQAPHVTVAVAGTVNTGVVPLVHRYEIAALPVAVVAELGSILLPAPVFVMLITGDAVKNLHTPMTIALTVTEALSLACAAPPTNAPKTTTPMDDRRIILPFLIPLTRRPLWRPPSRDKIAVTA